MLSDLPTLKIFAQIPDPTQDMVLTQLLLAADAAVKKYCKLNLETAYYIGPDAEYRDGNGYKDLPLWQLPVLLSPPGLTGTITQNSAVITALSLNAQTYLSVGMPAQVTGAAAQTVQAAFPAGTTILSVDSTSQVTCTANSTASGTAVKLVFGCRVYLDPAGFYGDGTGGFATTAGQSGIEMFLGLNYAIRRDAKAGKSKAALLTRLGGGIIGSTISGIWPGDWPAGFLSAKEGPYWPRGIGNVKIEYAAGYGTGATVNGTMPANTTIPLDLTQAVNGLAAWSWRNANSGLVQMVSSSFGGYEAAVQPLATALSESPQLGGVRTLLSHYRDRSF